MDCTAVVLRAPRSIAVETLAITPPGRGDLVVDVANSGVSTGTEALLWSGEMPSFPGMGYPLVPGYEAVGEVVEAGPGTGFAPGDRVFVPGATCYRDARGLFGAAASRLVTPAGRVARIDRALGEEGALLALAATALHAMAAPAAPPELIVGHGTLGRLLARVALGIGAPAPTVWEIDPDRAGGAAGYEVVHPDADPRRDYRTIYDASGDASLLDALIARLARGGEVVLAGFYPRPLTFAFPPAFMREARLRVAAEWRPEDLAATRALVEDGRLGLGGLVTHRRPATDAAEAYATAFGDPACLKMILDWSGQT